MPLDFPEQLFVAFGIDVDPDDPETDYLIADREPHLLFEGNERAKRIAVYRLVEIKQGERTVTLSSIS